MAAYHPTTFWALPFLLFLYKELTDAFCPNVFKIFDQTCPEEGPIPLIDGLQTFAWEITALIAVLNIAIHEDIASLFEKSTFLISFPTAITIGHSDALAFYIVF